MVREAGRVLEGNVEFDKKFYRQNFFKLERYRVSADKMADDSPEENEATVKILVPRKNAEGRIERRHLAEYQPKDKKFIALSGSANGDGTVDALDRALRIPLEPIYPFLKEVKLIRYSVSNISFKDGTSAQVEVFILASNAAGKLYFSEVKIEERHRGVVFRLLNIYNRYFRDEYLNGKKAGRK